MRVLEIPMYMGYLAHEKAPPSPGPPKGPKRSPTVGSWGVAVSYERGNPVTLPQEEEVEQRRRVCGLQGYLAHKKPRLPRTLQ